jgi:hypothetical protein
MEYVQEMNTWNAFTLFSGRHSRFSCCATSAFHSETCTIMVSSQVDELPDHRGSFASSGVMKGLRFCIRRRRVAAWEARVGYHVWYLVWTESLNLTNALFAVRKMRKMADFNWSFIHDSFDVAKGLILIEYGIQSNQSNLISKRKYQTQTREGPHSALQKR